MDPMFIAALLAITKIWKQPTCSLIDECMKKMCYIYTMKYYSVIEKNKILPFEALLMDLEGIMLSQLIQRKKYCMT